MPNHTQATKPALIKSKVHKINQQLISPQAIRVINTLQKAGYQAFIVGGAIRDLLLNIPPKDFDIATNATPHQTQQLFHRARIIGRRFQIVHVPFGREVIEVSTFRAAIDQETRSSNPSRHQTTDESGRLLRDNVWGTQQQDANRRDFTINALYYDPSTQLVYDYHNGLKDIQNKQLRMIGDPTTRYREDPVRILRAIRLAAKLKFQLAPETQAPIVEQKHLINNVPASRLFDEILKMLMSGHALASLDGLQQQGIADGLLPLLAFTSNQTQYQNFIRYSLIDTDKRIHSNKKASPSFLFAVLLWPDIEQNYQKLVQQGEYAYPAMFEALNTVFDIQMQKLAIHRRYLTDIREICILQLRLEKPSRQAFRIIEHPRFRAGYDFFLLRLEASQTDQKIAQWWESFLAGNQQQREELLSEYVTPSRSKPRQKKRYYKTS